MTVDSLVPFFIAGFLYIVSPGPILLSILGSVSQSGWKSGSAFACGALVGDSFWLALTLISLIEATRIPKFALDLLAGTCALYLFYLAYGMIRTRRPPERRRPFARPFAQGAALGLLNPKSYPVLVSVLAGAVLRVEGGLSRSDLPMSMVGSGAGFVAGYVGMIVLAGVPAVTTIYRRNARAFSMLFGLVFVGFGLNLLLGIR